MTLAADTESTAVVAVDSSVAAALDHLADQWSALTADACLEAGPLSSRQVLDLLSAFVATPGKRLRPRMCHWGWVAAGGHERPDAATGFEAMVTAGAALELLHAFGLIHDDVMDESAERRGSPALHVRARELHERAGGDGDPQRFGENVAILAGDLAHAEATRLAMALPPRMQRVWSTLSVELMIGQAKDLVGAAGRRRDLDHAREIARTKSGAYTVGRPLELGAVAAEATGETLAALRDYGRHVGEAFALRDDLLGAFGDPTRTGKPVGDDLLAGKPTVLLALAAAAPTPVAAAVVRRVEHRTLTGADVPAAQEQLRASGVVEQVERLIAAAIDSAVAALDRPGVHPDARAGLTQLAREVAWRSS